MMIVFKNLLHWREFLGFLVLPPKMGLLPLRFSSFPFGR
uniref:Uncharacterized protein n=1 Tax=Rhizophora mucronata TaxID=61149 RepID=A0A2P2N041_RHIMU